MIRFLRSVWYPAAAAAAAAAAPKVLTTAGSETINGTDADNQFTGLTSSTSTKTTFNSTDVITDSSTKDNDTLTLTLADDLAAASTASVRNVENIVVNVDASTTAAVAGGATANEFVLDVTNFSGVKSYTLDVTRAITGINDFLLNDAEDGSTVNASADFSAGEVTVETAGDDVTVNMAAVGTSGTPVVLTLTAGTAPGDVIATGAGNLSVQATTATGIVKATAEKGLTINSAAALVVMGEAKAGNLTVTNADAAVIVDVSASGTVSITDSGAGSVKAVAGGTVTLVASTGFGATSVNLSSTGTSTVVGSSVTSATLSGNGAAVTYAATSSPLADVSIEGSQNVTLQVGANTIDAATDILSVTDNSTGTLTLEVSGAGSVDLRGGSLIDRLEIDADQGGGSDTLSVLSGQTVVYTIDQTAQTLAVGQAAATTANSVTIVLDDESKASGAVDFNALTITQAKTVVIDASIDTTAAGTANPSTITALDASGPKSNVTINTGVNGLTLAGTNTVHATGTVTVTGSGAVALGSSTLTAASFDASAVTGSVTGTAFNVGNVPVIKTGSAADTLTVAGSTSLTIETGAGNDFLTLPASDFGGAANAVSINMGEGTDTLVLVNGTKVSKTTGGSVALSGVENITLEVDTSSDSQEIQASLLNGATYAIKGATVATAGAALVAKVASTDTTLDFSTLSFSDATDSSLAAATFTINAASAAASTVITGGAKIQNSITGSGTAGSSYADTLTGGTLNDTFNYSADADLFTSGNVMIDSIVGGAGNADILNVGGSSAFTIVALDSFAKMSGVERIVAGSGATGALSLTLGASAETAGITRVDISSGGASSNTVSVAAYTATGVTILGDSGASSTLTGGAGADAITGGTAVDNITGGEGNDAITGKGGADTLSGGLGDDSFNFTVATDASSVTTNPLFTPTSGGTAGSFTAASIAGGDGTDTIAVTNTLADGGTAAGLTIANDIPWTKVTSIETLSVGANGAAISISLDSTAWAAGLRTVSISADTATASIFNTIDANEIVGGGMTLTGGADEDSIRGGSGADTITGGDGVDTLTGGSGNDVYVFAATGALNDDDAITFVVANDKLDFSAFLGSSPLVLGASGVDASITSFTSSTNSDVNAAGKIAIFTTSADAGGSTSASALTVANVLAEITDAGNALSLASGKSVILAVSQDTNSGEEDYVVNVYYLDTTLDGASGLSSEDVVLVGHFSATGTLALTTANFVGY